MAKFCTKCGKPLEDGKTCDCEFTKKEESSKAGVVQTTSGVDINRYINSYIDIVKGIFTKPVDTMKKYIEGEQYILGIIAIVLNSLISGIFLYCLCSEAMGLIGSFMGYGSIFSGYAGDLPVMKIILYGLLFMVVGFFSTAGMIYVVANLILKDPIDIKKSISLVGVCSVFTTVTTIACLILTYISIKFMMIVLLVAGLFYLTYLYQAISESTKVDRNKLAYIFVPTVSIATFIVVYILPKILF